MMTSVLKGGRVITHSRYYLIHGLHVTVVSSCLKFSSKHASLLVDSRYKKDFIFESGYNII